MTFRSINNSRLINLRSIDGLGIRITDLYNDLNMNGFRIRGAAFPAIYEDEYVTLNELRSVSAGLDPKESSLYVTLSNIADFTNQAIVQNALDPVLAIQPILAVDNRVLVKDQIDQRENGIYVWSLTGLIRSPDMDGTPANEVSGGNFTFIENGDSLQNTGWVLSGNGILTLGVDNLIWFKFSAQITAQNVGGGRQVFKDITNQQNLRFRSLVPGSNISIAQAADTLTISNTAANTTLTSLGAQSLVSDGNGPTLSIRGINAGTDISVTSSATQLTITNTKATTTITSAGGTSLIQSNQPNIALKGLTAGANITLLNNANDIQISSTVPTPTASMIRVSYQELSAIDGVFIPATALTTVPFNTTGLSAGGHSRSSTNVVLATAGVYKITGVVSIDDQTGTVQTILYINGVANIRQNSRDEDTGSGQITTLDGFVNVGAGASLSLRVFLQKSARFGTASNNFTNSYASLSCNFIGV